MGLEFDEDNGLIYSEPNNYYEMDSILYRIVLDQYNGIGQDIYKVELDPTLDLVKITTNCQNWKTLDGWIVMYGQLLDQLKELRKELEE